MLPWVVLFLVGILLFAQSYEKWGDPIIDLGRDLYLPGRLLNGRILYRDILYNYGPVTPYLLAMLVRVFGDALPVFETFGILTGVAALYALYGIGALIGGRGIAFFSALLFLTLSFFARSTWGCNFVSPYSYAATISTALALWSFYFSLRYLYNGSHPADLWWSTGFLFATLFTKAEFGVAIVLVQMLAWSIHRIPLRVLAIIEIPFIMSSSLVKEGENEDIDSRKKWYKPGGHGDHFPFA